ncbi:helix-turn-helix transcriptional regulator [Arthrobacter alpinus]|nr:helix-turn-helix transcriptional regulator [Arthrobacter alpinus]
MHIQPDFRAFGENLRKLRKEKVRLTQSEFAFYVNMDRSYISGLECGHANPSLDIIVRLAHGLGVHPGELLKPLPKVPLLSNGEPAS